MPTQGKDLTPPLFTTIDGIAPASNPQARTLTSGRGSASIREDIASDDELADKPGIPGYSPPESERIASQQAHLVRIAHSLAHLQMENRRALEAGLLRLHDSMLRAMTLVTRIDKLVHGGDANGIEQPGQAGNQDAGQD